MTPEGYKKHREVIEAWADGAEVQIKVLNEWLSVDPEWTRCSEYRIKPKPQKREVWVNIYGGSVDAYPTRSSADANAGYGGRKACVLLNIKWTEGEGKPMSDWQPIETAPKSGTFLVWLKDEHQVMQTHAGIMMNRPNVQFINGLFSHDLSKPTHWQPLPNPPEDTA